MDKRRLSVRETVFVAVMAAVMCVFAPLSIPMGAVPLSLATLVVYLDGALLGKAKGCAAVIVYIFIGLAGVPVFSGFIGGLAAVTGITGGYIIGYIPCAYITALFAQRFGGRILAMAAGMVLGTAALYIFGTAWYMLLTGAEIAAALAACVIPFLAGDAVKIAAACALAAPLRKKLLPVMNNFNFK